MRWRKLRAQVTENKGFDGLLHFCAGEASRFFDSGERRDSKTICGVGTAESEVEGNG